MTPFRERNKTVIGAVGIGVIVAMLVGAFNIEKFLGGDDYKADFTEAAGLRPGDEVRIAGVKVGKVKEVELAGDRVRIGFHIKGADLGKETRADIKLKTLLGRKYLSLTPDGTGKLDGDSIIPLQRTSSPYDVTEAFPDLATTVDKIDTDQLARSFQVLSETFRDTPDEVQASLRGLSRISRTIASRDQQLKQLLTRSRNVTEVLARRDQDLVVLMRDSSLILNELRQRRAIISQLLDNTTRLSEQLVALTRENRATLAPALARLRGIVTVLRANERNLDLAIPRLASFTRLFSNNLGNGRWFDTFTINLFSPAEMQPGQFPGGQR